MAGAPIRVGGQLGERAREVLAGRQAPAQPRDAATVMLLRPEGGGGAGGGASGGAGGGASSGLEVYMLRRKPSMAFAPGAFVFPGGSVDARDADEQVAWAGPDTAAWGQIFDAPPRLARALVCAAVRETFEESGVLLAGPSAGEVVADTTGEQWEADRQALLDRSLSLAEMLSRRGLVLRSDLLRPWSRWITPVIEERRFDARFFAAALPRRQRTRDVGGEAAEVAWVRPADAIAQGRARQIVLWPPTAVTLAELAACQDVTAALAPRQVSPVLPEASEAEGAVWLTLPAELEYPL
ncbi:MAG TPA: NUDIX hydrolase [Streptosporangiaceae bacterium]|jgi:8-oxo-dGTP pyrophosphatase MutT (NUDIX family)|nr:NUDIX hydrolase [Streptosporangiaceae bacterium]